MDMTKVPVNSKKKGRDVASILATKLVCRRGSLMDIVMEAEKVIAEGATKDAVEKYLNELRMIDLSLTTIEKYEQCLRTFEKWLDGREASVLTVRHFIGYLKQQGFSSSTQRGYYHALRPFLKFMGIAYHQKFSKERKLPVYHSTDQVKAILGIVKNRNDNWSFLAPRDELIILMLAYTGMRRAEILNLKLRDINFHSRMFKVTGKGSKERTIPISDAIYDRLQGYTAKLNPSDIVFPVKPKRIYNMVKRYARKAGITDFHPHSFRHYFATQLVEQGVSLKIVQELLGHADISTTSIYLDVCPVHLNDAITHLPKL
jgi:integrase/recombinase XerD